MKVSIVVPAYNEEAGLPDLLDRLDRLDLSPIGFDKEVIVVDDGSTDRTAEIVRRHPVTLIQQANQGKGAAVQAGVQRASGDYVFVQDADLEYAPEDIPALALATEHRLDVVVYGSRPRGVIAEHGLRLPFVGRHPRQGLAPWGMNCLLSALILALYRRGVSDPLTGSKLYPTLLLRRVKVETRGFETDHELTAKLIHLGAEIRSVPISYQPRSVAEGKKIRAIDGWIAVRTLVRYRNANP
jgi:glycosyltransferase involved in cell wall biosynthesis